MKKNKKPIKFQHLIGIKLALFVVCSVVLVICFYNVLMFFFDASLVKSSSYDALNIDLLDYDNIDSQYLIDNQATIEIVDNNLKVIKSKGMYKNTNYQYEPLEFVDLLNNNSNFENIVYEMFYAKDGNEYTIVLKQTTRQTSIKILTNLSLLYLGLLLLGTITIFTLAFILFVKSINKNIRHSFNFIQDNISKLPYDNTKVNVSENNICEVRNVMSSYNSMLDELNRIKNEKNDISKQRNQLISNLSHDLKSPITTIKGYTEVLLDDSLCKDDRKEYLSYISKSVTDLNELISLLFQQVKFQYSDYQLNLEKVDINNFLRDICANYYMLFNKEGFDFEVNIYEFTVLLFLDKIQLKRAFTNILENCISHNPNPTKVKVVTEISNKDFNIYFMDNGIGIKPQDKKNIFDPFYQGNYSRNTCHNGIGLFVTKQIIEKHGGTIILTQNENYKTIFKISFPQLPL